MARGKAGHGMARHGEAWRGTVRQGEDKNMSGLFGVFIGFALGFIVGTLVLVYKATQPNGYLAIGGYRMKLVRLDQDGGTLL